MKTVCAIDPGPTQSAFLIWDGAKVLQAGLRDNDSIRERLRDGGAYDFVAIEMVACYGMPVGAEPFGINS